MLPDFPILKEAFNQAVTRIMAERTKVHQGPLGALRRARVFEGRNTSIVRPDGTEDQTHMNEASAQVTITLDEIKDLGLQELFERLDKIAFDMARQQSEHFYQAMKEGSEKAGTTVDAQGQNFTADLFLTLLDRVSIEFGPDGSPRMPSLHIPPGSQEAVTNAIARLDREPELRQKFDKIINRKREEWHAREVDRGLVG
jgi:predicted transcriptional regulator